MHPAVARVRRLDVQAAFAGTLKGWGFRHRPQSRPERRRPQKIRERRCPEHPTVWKTLGTTKGKQKRALKFAIGVGFLNAFLDPAEGGIGLHRYFVCVAKFLGAGVLEAGVCRENEQGASGKQLNLCEVSAAPMRRDSAGAGRFNRCTAPYVGKPAAKAPDSATTRLRRAMRHTL